MSGVSAEPCYGTYRPFYFTDYIPHSHSEKPAQQNNKDMNLEKQISEEGKLPVIFCL